MSRIESLLQMLEDEPDDLFLNYALALEYKVVDPLRTIAILEKLCFTEPTYLPAYYQLATLYFEQNNTTKARAIALEGIEKAKHSGQKHTLSELQDLLALIELAD